MKTFCYELLATLNTYYVRSQSVCVHQDVSYDIMTDERFAIAIWFALFARVVHLFLRYSTSFILSWIAITLALRIFMYLTMYCHFVFVQDYLSRKITSQYTVSTKLYLHIATIFHSFISKQIQKCIVNTLFCYLPFIKNIRRRQRIGSLVAL